MAITPIAPLLFVQQMGPAGKLVTEIATQPEMSQKTFHQVVEATLRRQGMQIQEISGKEASIAVNEEGSNNKKKFSKMFKGRQGTKPPEDDEDDLLSYQDEPYLGNLVNRKV